MDKGFVIQLSPAATRNEAGSLAVTYRPRNLTRRRCTSGASEGMRRFTISAAAALFAWMTILQFIPDVFGSHGEVAQTNEIRPRSEDPGTQVVHRVAQALNQRANAPAGEQPGTSRSAASGTVAQAAAQQTPSAQTPAQQSATQPSAPAPTRTTDSSEETFRPRLPMYYGKVVTEEQRQKIYDIQRKYFPQIRALQKQLDALIAKRDAEIEAVLTPQQKAEIERLRKEAAARRAGGAAATQEQRTSSTEK
jgi:Spy/CpxP family protein refolding chaperone